MAPCFPRAAIWQRATSRSRSPSKPFRGRSTAMPETTKAPSKHASLEGQAILAYPDADVRCRRIWKGGEYVAVAPLGHLQPAGSTLALCGLETGCGNYATEDALRLCRNCVEKAVRPTQRKSEIRAENNALRERNRALVGAAQGVANYGAHPPIADNLWIGPPWMDPNVPDALARAIVGLRAALAADAKAGEDR